MKKHTASLHKKLQKTNRNRLRFALSISLLTVTATFIISTDARQLPPPGSVAVYQTPVENAAGGIGNAAVPAWAGRPHPVATEIPDTGNDAAPPRTGQPYLVAAAVPDTDDDDARQDQRHRVAIATPGAGNDAAPARQYPPQVHHYTVKPGDTLSDILEHFGLVHELRHLLSLDKKTLKAIAKLLAGKPVTLAIKEGSLEQFIYHASPVERLIISRPRKGAPLTFERQLVAVEKSTAYASATIKNSLYLAAKDAGMSDNLIMEMAAILGWDIDFAYGIRSGDHFTIIYEEEYVGADKLRDGDIIAIHFRNNGRHHHIVSYTDSKNKKGFYSAGGKSVRKPFLRNPLDFAYVSSHFNPRRKHPILHKVRAHNGVDYAAPRGTPVRAAGDGVITMRGRNGGYGKTVVIRHGQTYQTLYAHLSRFASGQRTGSRVKQGQVIGYVGSTGLSTGPHLHYEFLVNGVHRNPVKVKLPDAKPLPATEMKRFRQTIEPLLAKLNLLSKAYLTSLEASATAP